MIRWTFILYFSLTFLSSFGIDHLSNTLFPDTFLVNNSDHYINLSAKLIQEGKLEDARKVIDIGLKKSDKDKNINLTTNLKYFLADYNYYKQNYDTAHLLYFEVLPSFKKEHDTLMIAKTLNSIGLIYGFEQNNEQTIKYYIQEIELLDQVKHPNSSLNTERIVLLTNMINLYFHTEEYLEVIEYAPDAIELATQMNDSLRLGAILNTLGLAYKNNNDINKAIETFHTTSRLFQSLNNEFRNSFVLLNMGGLYEGLNEFPDSALHYYQIALKGFEKEDYKTGIIQSKLGIATVLATLKQQQEAREVYRQVIDTALTYKVFPSLLEAYQNLGQLEYDMGNYQKAFNLINKYNTLSDTLFTVEKHKQFTEIQTKYQISQKENEINVLKTEKLLQELNLKKNQLHKQISISISFFLAILITIIFLFSRQKSKVNRTLVDKNDEIEIQNNKLTAMNEQITSMNKRLKKSQNQLIVSNNSKNRFFSILAHDLRNPFHNIMGQSYLLSKQYTQLSENERKKYANEIYQSCDKESKLLENLLEWSRTQLHSITFQPELINIKSLAQNAISLLQNNAIAKSITIANKIESPIEVTADRAMIETIFRNLLNNSIKYTPVGGTITISCKLYDQNLLTTVEDNGVGIEQKNTEKIFELDSKIKTKGTNDERGTGLGLVICKEFINFHRGKIWVESKLHKGSKFFFEIPTHQKLK